MEKELIHKLFMKARLDIHSLDVFAHNMAQGSSFIRPQAAELHRLASQASCSTLAFKCAMDGIEPPKSG